jgi:aryl-alcohol dehydrogenase-like predicted oxidoreductase
LIFQKLTISPASGTSLPGAGSVAHLGENTAAGALQLDSAELAALG